MKVFIDVDDELFDSLDRISKEDGVSLSTLINDLIKLAIFQNNDLLFDFYPSYKK